MTCRCASTTAPPPPVSASAAAGASVSAAAHSAARAWVVTVSELLVVSFRRFRGELTGSRWKELRYAGARPAIRPELLGSPGRPDRGPGRFSDDYEGSELRTDEKVSAGVG